MRLYSRKMKLRIYVMALASMSLLTACDQANNQTSNNIENTITQTEPASTIWPYLSQDNEVISENLVADNIYVVFDGSGSMNSIGCSEGQPKYIAAQKALKVFSKIVSADTNLGFLAFDAQGTTERVPLGLNNRDNFNAQVNSVIISGGTPLRSAMKIAYDKLTSQAQKQLGYGRYQLVVVTDGQANSGEDPYQLVTEITNASPVEVHTIGFCISKNHSLNIPGITVYKSAMNTEALQKGLESTLAESPTFSVKFN